MIESSFFLQIHFMIPQIIGSMHTIFLDLIMESIDISLLWLIVCHRNALPCKSLYFQVSSRSWSTSNTYQKKECVVWNSAHLTARRNYQKSHWKTYSCEIFSSICNKIQVLCTFLRYFILKGQDYSQFNKIRLD